MAAGPAAGFRPGWNNNSDSVEPDVLRPKSKKKHSAASQFARGEPHAGVASTEGAGEEDRVVEFSSERVPHQALQAQSGMLGIFDARGQRIKAGKTGKHAVSKKSKPKDGRKDAAGSKAWTGSAAAEMLQHQQFESLKGSSNGVLGAW